MPFKLMMSSTCIGVYDSRSEALVSAFERGLVHDNAHGGARRNSLLPHVKVFEIKVDEEVLVTPFSSMPKEVEKELRVRSKVHKKQQTQQYTREGKPLPIRGSLDTRTSEIVPGHIKEDGVWRRLK